MNYNLNFYNFKVGVIIAISGGILMRKNIVIWIVLLLFVFLIPVNVSANIMCNDGTMSPSCKVCSQGCCSWHGGCASSSYNYSYNDYDSYDYDSYDYDYNYKYDDYNYKYDDYDYDDYDYDDYNESSYSYYMEDDYDNSDNDNSVIGFLFSLALFYGVPIAISYLVDFFKNI